MINEKEIIRAYRVPAMSLAMVACIVLALFGTWRLMTYSLPMQWEDFRSASEASTGDRALALYDWGVQEYKRENYPLAKDILTESFNELSKNTGVVPPEKAELASRIQFMLGVVNEHNKQFRVAVTAYEDCLRFDPDNMPAKYNLERLKSKYLDIGKGKGSPTDPPDQPTTGRNNNKKGI